MLIVVGGGGFIGSHLRRRLSAEGLSDVVVVANNDLSFPLRTAEKQVSREEFNGALGNELLAQAEAIVYLASASTVQTFIDSPWNELKYNVEPLMHLLHRIGESGSSCRFVFVSSGGTVYGKTSMSDPIPETHPLQPISAYGLGKVLQEQALAFFGRTNHLNHCVLRLANPVGVFGRSQSQGLVTAALRAVASKSALTLFGDGTHVRDLFDADDAADAILRAMLTREHSGATWNVGSGQGLSNIEVIRMVERVTSKKVLLDRRSARESDVPFIVLDTSRISEDLGWIAARGLEETIDEIWRCNFRADRRDYF